MSEKLPSSSNNYTEEEIMELRRGPWTLEEDALLMHYIASHGEGRWNLLARCSGLKRTGKSCRLRWLNYLKPDIKRGNLSPEEQFLIHELHSKWGNRWSRIAQNLPGRTDNEIKNYWRTRVQKQARQLKIDTNSPAFQDAVRCYWMPRLMEKLKASNSLQSIDHQHIHVNNPASHYQTLEQVDHPPAEHEHDHSLYDIPRMQYQIQNCGPYSGASTEVQQEPNYAYYGISTCSSQEQNCITFNQISSSCKEEKPYNNCTATVTPMSASELSHSLSGCPVATGHDNIFIMDSSDGVEGGDNNLWCMDDLYGMLKSYFNGADSEADPFFDS